MSTADLSHPLRADARRNRERLLAAALAAFTEHGADDISLEEIARRAGVGIGTLYRHFPSRQALLEAVYRDQVEMLCAQALSLRAAPPAEALATWLRQMIEFGLTKHTLTSALAGAGKDAPVFSACREDLLAAAGSLLTRAQQAGEVRPDLGPSDLLRFTHAIVMATEKLPGRAAEAERLLTLLLEGLLPRPA